MPEMKSLQVAEIVFKRLVALAQARSTKPEEPVIEALQNFTGSAEARRAIRKHRSGAALTDLGWIDGYEGQAVDDILSFAETENPYLVLSELADSIGRHCVIRRDLLRLGAAVFLKLSLRWSEAIVQYADDESELQIAWAFVSSPRRPAATLAEQILPPVKRKYHTRFSSTL